MEVMMRDWYGLYRGGWQGEIVPEAFSHPAKFARGLIRKIYDYAIEQGYLREGAVVIDPFAGVALGGLDAMFHGLHWIGCELEDKFVQLGQQNIKWWNEKYGDGMLRRWGTAVILQGDSRQLVEVLEGACLCLSGRQVSADRARAEGIVSSPPWESVEVCQDKTFWLSDGRKTPPQGQPGYGKAEGQLGNLPTGEPPACSLPDGKAGADRPQGIIGSPPYAESDMGGRGGEGPGAAGAPHGGKHQACGQASGIGYGHTDGQLAAMREGDLPVGEAGVDAVIASPPWVSTEGSHSAAKFADPEGSAERRAEAYRTGKIKGHSASKEAILRAMQKANQSTYGASDGQLAALPEGEPPQEVDVLEWINKARQCVDTDPHLANYMVRDLPQTKEADLDDLAWAIHEGNPSKNDVIGLLDLLEKYLQEGLPLTAIVSSPPHEDSMDSGDEDAEGRAQRADGFKQGMTTFRYGQNPYTFLSKDPSGLSNEQRHELAAQNPQIGALKQDTFWSAARAILLQCHAVLAPGGTAIFVTKRFVRGGKIVEFSRQWADLCQSCGFELIEWIKAWLVEEGGTQFDLMGDAHTKKVERKSFFRRLAEFKARAAKFWLSVSRDDKAVYLWFAHEALWQNYRERLDTESPAPHPNRYRILSNAQSTAYAEAGAPDIEIETQIDWEDVLVFRKPGNAI